MQASKRTYMLTTLGSSDWRRNRVAARSVEGLGRETHEFKVGKERERGGDAGASQRKLLLMGEI